MVSRLKLLSTTIFLLFLGSCKNSNSNTDTAGLIENLEIVQRIPIGENSWISNNTSSRSRIITQKGIQGWINLDQKVISYFRINGTGELQLSLKVRIPSGSSTLKINFAGETKQIKIENTEYEEVFIGTFDIDQEGYYDLEIELLNKTGSGIVDIEEILVGGPAAESEINFVQDNFHFGRRGPSVHLRYDYPDDEEVLYFYNEIEVPNGEDVIGSFFMANGFSHGYFGIQVNSKNERRILFSVWSPYETQDPKEIPEDYRITLLKKGDDVYSGEFGNEGSGGQSYKKYMWSADTTYRFLLKGEPTGENSTDYTAYFYAPEKGEWELIASFRRPYTDNYLGNLHSFLENFNPSTGNIARKALYKNQWVYSTENRWTQSTKATFTADATARAGDRMDFAGGVEGEAFFMKNCGFFNDYTEMDSQFQREPNRKTPEIDFKNLQ